MSTVFRKFRSMVECIDWLREEGATSLPKMQLYGDFGQNETFNRGVGCSEDGPAIVFAPDGTVTLAWRNEWMQYCIG